MNEEVERNKEGKYKHMIPSIASLLSKQHIWSAGQLKKGEKGRKRGPGGPSIERCTDLTIFQRLRGAIVVHHAAGLLILCCKKQRSEFLHL